MSWSKPEWPRKMAAPMVCLEAVVDGPEIIMAPNLFDYATAELSQDAFFCWLLAWGDESNASVDETLNHLGLAFLNALLATHGEASVANVRIEVRRQVAGADIVAEVGTDLVLLIEDKIDAGPHGDQLARYRPLMAERYPGRRILPLFLKTGDQSSYAEVENAGYRPFLRDQVLDLLRPWRARTVNAIVTDFLANLERRHARVEAYAAEPVSSWAELPDAWIGLYKRLQHELPGLEWGYVSNPAGGFMGAWWSETCLVDPSTGRACRTYLQIEQGPLCFKLAISDSEEDRSGARDRCHDRLILAAREAGLAVARPTRMGLGARVTIGRIEKREWLAEGPDGLIDLNRTLANLRTAASVLDRLT